MSRSSLADRCLDIAKGFLEVAKQLETLATRSPTKLIKEAAVRTGVNRAYYAAFIAVRRFLGIEDLQEPTVHRLAVEMPKAKNRSDIADKLADLRRRRSAADYDTRKVFTLRELSWAIAVAQHILSKMLQT